MVLCQNPCTHKSRIINFNISKLKLKQDKKHTKIRAYEFSYFLTLKAPNKILLCCLQNPNQVSPMTFRKILQLIHLGGQHHHIFESIHWSFAEAKLPKTTTLAGNHRRRRKFLNLFIYVKKTNKTFLENHFLFQEDKERKNIFQLELI